MERKLRIVLSGPKSIHLENYCRGLLLHTDNFGLICEENVQYNGIDDTVITSFRGINPLHWLRNYFKLEQFIKKYKPDVIHIHQANRLAFFVSWIAYRLNIRVITTVWGSDVLLMPRRNLLYRFITHRILFCSSVITADSDEMIKEMRIIHPNGNYKNIQYGIEQILKTQKEKIIYSNRLHEPLYQIDKVIELFSEFSKKHPEWKLYIGAVGKQTPYLKELVNTLKINERVEFLGWLDKIQNQQIYTKSSIFVSIPTSDGTSVSLLEAMSAGCIPIVSDIPVYHEWIKDKQNGVFLNPQTNPFEIALELDSNRLEKINRRLIEEKALRQNTSRYFFELYEAARK